MNGRYRQLLAFCCAFLLSAEAPRGHGPHEGREGPRRGRPGELAAPREPAPYLRDLFPSTYKPLPRTDTLIVHATILDGEDRRIDDGELLIRAGKIVALGHGLDRTGATIIDAHNGWITPGLIDIHSHNGTYVVPLSTIDEKSSDVSELSDPNAAGTWIETAINPQDPAFPAALAGGVTTLQILPGSSPIFGGRSVVLHPITATTMQAMKVPGAAQGMKMSCGENPKSNGAETGRGPTSRQGEIAYIRDAVAKARHYRHEWDEYLSGADGRHPEDDPKMDTLAAALAGDIAVHMHCYRASDMAIMIDLSHQIGFRIAAFHHAVEAYKIAPLLAANHICTAVWSDWWGYKMEALDGIRENAAFVDAAGGCPMMHSDSPFIGQWLNVEAGKAAAAGRRAGLSLPPEHVLSWITSNPAKLLGLFNRIGSLAPGKNADVVLWSGNPFSVFSQAQIVFIDGAKVFDRTDVGYQPKSDFTIGRAPGSTR